MTITTEEALLLERAAVFAESFVIDAAEDVCAGDGVDAAEVLDLVDSLLEKGLLVREGGDPMRYRVRDGGAAVPAALRRRHLAWYADLVGTEISPDRLRAELPNLRAALELAEDDTAERLRLAVAVAEQVSAPPPKARTSVLTPREEEVAVLIAEGLSNREIAARLSISQRTAQGHVENILRKLDFGSRAQVAAWVVSRRTL